MNTDYVVKRSLVGGVIVLFIGVALAPGITADIPTISKDDELVEITTEVCGIEGIEPQTIYLTKQQAEELDDLFDDIKARSDEVETREETVNIFNEAVVKLDAYGLLPDSMGVEEAQKLLIGRSHSTGMMSLFSRKCSEYNAGFFEYMNIMCFVAGEMFHGVFISPIAILVFLLSLPFLVLFFYMALSDFSFGPLVDIIITILGWSGLGLLYISDWINPFPIAHFVSLGTPGEGQLHGVGWIRAIGLLGIDRLDDEFSGFMLGFTGFKISIEGQTYDHRFIGFAPFGMFIQE